MDLYQKNPATLRRLLNKRQNSYTQIFKQQPSNSTSVPMSAMDLPRNGFSTTNEENLPHFTVEDVNVNTNLSDMFTQSQFQSQTAQEDSITHDSVHSPSQMEEDDDDEPLLDRVQKKIKSTMISHQGLKSQRSFGCEEEKEQSEHSTACDIRSEPNNVNETGDFLLSPSMGSHCSKDLPEIRLDGNEDSPIRSGVIHINLTPEEVNTAIGQQASENLNSCPKPKTRIRCKLNHAYEVEEHTTSEQPCPRCQELLEECRAFANKNEGTCLNQEYEETIRYRCTKGHVWSLNYKNARRRWCAQCSKEQRNLLKKKCEEEKLEREKQEEECQQKLFEEARKRASAAGNGSQPFKPSGINNNSQQKGINTLEYFQRMDYEIETLAKKYTISFMSQKEFTGDLHYQQILQVYKIMIMPEEILQAYMFNLNADTLRSEFRRMAKIIHPDKNKHPQAGNAFQKIYKVYEIALSRFEGTQQKI